MLLATRSLSWQDVGNSLSTKVIMLVAASLALGSALSTTGGTAFLANQLVSLAGVREAGERAVEDGHHEARRLGDPEYRHLQQVEAHRPQRKAEPARDGIGASEFRAH